MKVTLKYHPIKNWKKYQTEMILEMKHSIFQAKPFMRSLTTSERHIEIIMSGMGN